MQIQGSASPVPLDHRRGKHSKHQAAIFQCVRFQKAVIQTSCHPTRPRAGAPDCRLETPTSPTPRATSLLGRSPGNADGGHSSRQRFHRHDPSVRAGLQRICRLDIFYNATNGSYYPGRGGGAATQHRYCTNISWSDAQPGDLVFYPDDSHVGIVGGRDADSNLLIVHCSGGANGVVITDSAGFTTVARPDCFTKSALKHIPKSAIK